MRTGVPHQDAIGDVAVEKYQRSRRPADPGRNLAAYVTEIVQEGR